MPATCSEAPSASTCPGLAPSCRRMANMADCLGQDAVWPATWVNLVCRKLANRRLGTQTGLMVRTWRVLGDLVGVA